MVKKKYVPDRRDVVWIDLNPTRGHEQALVRPAVVLSPKAYNQKTNLALMCPITTHIKEYPFEVALKEKKVSGAILSDQIRSLDWVNRKAKFIQKISPAVFEEVEAKIQALLFDR